MSLKRLFSKVYQGGITLFIKDHSLLLLCLFYANDFWRLRHSCVRKRTKLKETLYYAYLQRFGAWIGLGATFDGKPTLPHSFYGIFISHNAHIGKNVTIFHQVTIGSNSIRDSKKQGSPVIGNNVYIGCGAKIIGNCHIGENVRVGANCIVTKDVPNNSVCIMRGIEIIQKDEPLVNTWIKENG